MKSYLSSGVYAIMLTAAVLQCTLTTASQLSGFEVDLALIPVSQVHESTARRRLASPH